MKIFFEPQDLIALPFFEFCDGDPRPARDDTVDLFLGNFVLQEGVFSAAYARFRRFEFLLERGKVAVSETGSFFQLPFGQCGIDLAFYGVDLLFQLFFRTNGVLLVLPLRLHAAEGLFQLGEFFAERFEPRRRKIVAFLRKRLFFHFELGDLPVHRVHLGGHGIDLRTDHRRRFVHEVDRLIGKKTVGDIAVGKHRRRDERVVVNPHAVEDLEPLF